MAQVHQEPSSPALHRLRSGTAARLAGLPVTTLRVWERRYGVVAATRTEGGQRVYSAHDVSRLRLLRQLTQAGHAIGLIATLELESLQALADDTSAPMSPAGAAAGAAPAAVVIGRSAAKLLEAVPGCSILAVHDDLEQAESAQLPEGEVGLLLVRLASLQPSDAERVLVLGASLGARAIFVAYAFGTEASARALGEAGVTVRREPLAGRELAQWVRSVREAPTRAAPSWRVAPRRFSDEALARLTEMRSTVACECLRHLAEIVAQLAGFERYSEDCSSGSPADAALHRQLSRTAGVARVMFEQELQRVVDAEALKVSDQPGY